MNSSPKKHKLNRFTTLPVLLDMLLNKNLVFSNPKYWDDKNDTELLEIYRQKKIGNNKDKNTLFALCFLNDHETIHHWKTFADGICGCCIEFDKAKLIKLFCEPKSAGVKFGSVIYKKLDDAIDGAIDDCEDMIPFKKRWPYRFEKEFRAIWIGDTDCYQIKNIDLTMITKITISQKMPENTYSAVRDHLKCLDIGSETVINRSTIYENKCWIGKFRRKWSCPDLAS
jgi:hypothetical protein